MQKPFTHLGLFEGIGGFSLAARWMGWKTVAWCEWNPFGQKVLRHHFPEAIGHGDITKTDFTPYANTIDILTGGFPCQPYSSAGKRLGKEDERHLWPEMLRAIREVKPRWIVGENVSGLLNWNGGMVVDEIKTDLEASGYTIIPPCILPACAVNAPHRRDRVWIIAHAKSNSFGNVLRNERQNPQAIQEERFNEPVHAAHANNEGLQGGKNKGSLRSIRKERNEQPAGLLRTDWQDFPTQSPVYSGNDGLSFGLDTGAISVAAWRKESIKAGGNAIVPQVAYQIFKAIEQYEMMISEQNQRGSVATAAEQNPEP